MTATLFLTAAASALIIATPGVAVAAPLSPVLVSNEQPVDSGPQGDCSNPNTGSNPGGNGVGANGSTGGSMSGSTGASTTQCAPGTGGSTAGNSRTDQNGRSGLG